MFVIKVNLCCMLYQCPSFCVVVVYCLTNHALEEKSQVTLGNQATESIYVERNYYVLFVSRFPQVLKVFYVFFKIF